MPRYNRYRSDKPSPSHTHRLYSQLLGKPSASICTVGNSFFSKLLSSSYIISFSSAFLLHSCRIGACFYSTCLVSFPVSLLSYFRYSLPLDSRHLFHDGTTANAICKTWLRRRNQKICLWTTRDARLNTPLRNDTKAHFDIWLRQTISTLGVPGIEEPDFTSRQGKGENCEATSTSTREHTCRGPQAHSPAQVRQRFEDLASRGEMGTASKNTKDGFTGSRAMSCLLWQHNHSGCSDGTSA